MTSNKELTVPPLFLEFVQNFVQEYLEVIEQKKENAVQRQKPSTSYTREIRCMMHSFGDCKQPLWNSVLYVEKILRQQMNLLLTKSSEVAHVRNGEFISHEDLLFLLRKNKVKIKRLLQYLNIKDAKEMMHQPTKLSDLIRNPAIGKRVKKCLKFLSMIDNVFMYAEILKEDIPDPTVQSRNERKFIMVNSMSNEEYKEFKYTQQATFFPKGGADEFLAWLLEDRVTDMTPSPLALEIINYLARETICEIIDFVMMLRKDKNPSTAHIVLPIPPIKEEAVEMDSDVQEKQTIDDSQEAITVLEIQEAMHRYVKVSNQNELFCKENLDVLVPKCLLCC